MEKASAESGERAPSRGPGSLPLGQQLLGAGKLTEDEIVRVVSAQRQRNVRFGEAAIHLGFVSQEDVQAALARQFDYPRASPDDTTFSPLLVAATQPHCRQSEAFRALRSQLLLRWFAERRKALAVTASRRGQGTSTLAANLAILFAQMGERTVLIDANLRSPAQSRLFGLDSRPGLSDVLTGRCTVQDALCAVGEFDNLWVLPAGVPPPNPQELLGRVAFSYLIETAPAGFDIVIVDTPPILEFADALLISALTRGCILAVRRNEARVADISQVRNELQPTAAELVGAVVFD